MESKIRFANNRLKNSFEKLKIKNKEMYCFIEKAFEDIERNAFCGVQIPKRLIPKKYSQKYRIKNLWKYNLPNAWRLIYSVESNQFLIISIILEWFDYKEYEKRFRY